MTINDLQNALLDQTSDKARSWLDNSLVKLESSSDLNNDFLLYSALCQRKLGPEGKTDKTLKLSQLPAFSLADAARVILLNKALGHTATGKQSEFLWNAYRRGDDQEKAAIMKGLALLDPGGAHSDLAIHNGRTNNSELFAALALNNIYPALFFDERAFNQMLLKALFMDLDISGVENLATRHNATLTKLAMDLVYERLAANRQPPPSIWLALQFNQLNETQCITVQAHIQSEDEKQRYYCAQALHLWAQPIHSPILREAVLQQNEQEQQVAIRSTLSKVAANQL